jgi:phosphoglycerate dehydrogenase-like enzyme
MAVDSLRIAVNVAPDSPDADTFRQAMAPFAERVTLRFGADLLASGVLADAQVLVAQRISDEQLAAAPELRWFASWAAGLDTVARPSVLARHLVLTNASGVHGPGIAEQALAMMLMFTRELPRFVRAQLARTWDRPSSTARGLDELTGKTLAIIGLGRLGDALAERARPFGMHILGVKRDPSFRHDAKATVDEVHGFDQLDAVLARAHHVVLLVPLTRDTRHLVDGPRLSRMRKDAYLYNFARGPVVDEAALVRALTDGTIAGAGLDVFEEEPLPPTSPLWALPNVILTPHTAGLTPHYFARVAALLATNVGHWLAGTPLVNVFDPSRGY